MLQKRYKSNFVEGGISFGGEKNKTEQPTGDDEFKYSVFMYDLNAGFDLGLSDYWSIVPRVGFESEINKAKEGDSKANTPNAVISIGLRHSF